MTDQQTDRTAMQEPPEAAEAVLDRILDSTDLPDSFSLLGREWSLHPGVFPGTLTGATEVMASVVPYPRGGSFLEVGCGSGVIAVTAALSGCANVTAVDISPKAVSNTMENARRFGVSHLVEAVPSDLFDAIAPQRRFDTIFWNVPWTWTDETFSLRSDLHSAVFDPEYAGHRRYIAEAANRITENGRVLIGTADLGEREVIDAAAAEAGLQVRLAQRVRRIEVVRVMEYHLLELTPVGT
ncbi:methyltransferase [Salinifilum ghardaiensis]